MPCVRIARDRDGNARALLRRSSLVLGLALIVVATGFGGTASAALTGLQRVHAETVSNSFDKAVGVSCPAGKQVTGAGAEIFNGAGQVVLTDVIPNGALTGVTAEASEDQNGYASNWFMRAYAICATPPPGLERILAESSFDSVNKTVTATCPAGKRLLGAGGEISAGGGQVVLEDVRPNKGLGSITVQGVEDQDGTAGNWFARAYAICANPVHLLERVVTTSPTNSVDKGAIATCPAGKRVVGAGGEIGGGTGHVVMDDVRPGAPLQSVTVQAFEDEDGTTRNWFVRAIAICAAASQRMVGTTPIDSSGFKQVFASCPSDTEPTGGGGDVTGGRGQVKIHLLSRVGGFVTPHAFRADGAEDDTGYAETWFARAYAICATPLPGLHQRSTFSPEDSSSPKSVTATCPAGQRVVGAGGGAGGGPGFLGTQLVLDDVMPDAALTSVTATGIEDESGFAGDWHVVAYAICATPPPGLERVLATSPTNSFNKSVTATCPNGKNLLGTGAEIEGGLGQVVLDDVTPNAALTNVIVTGLEDETGHAGAWSLRSYAICANP